MIETYRPSVEFEELLNAICEEGLTDAQARRLEQIVESDDEDCRYYLMYVHLHGILYWNTARRLPDSAAPTSRANSAGKTPAPQDAGVRQSAPSEPARPIVPVNGFRYSLHPLLSSAVFSYALAALVLGVGVLGAWAWYGRGPGQAGSNGPGPTAVAGDYGPAAAVARIIGVRDCRCADPQTAVAMGQTVAVGRKFSLTSGRLEIAYNIGDRVTLEGPATFEVSSATGGKLSLGKLTFHSMLADLLGPVSDLPSKGYDKPPIFVRPLFAIRGPGVIVIDEGAEYSLAIDESGVSHTVLAKGKIEVRYPHGVKPGDSMGGRCWWYAEGDKTHFLRAVCQCGDMPPSLQAEMANSQRSDGRRFVGISRSAPVDLLPSEKSAGGISVKPEVGLP